MTTLRPTLRLLTCLALLAPACTDLAENGAQAGNENSNDEEVPSVDPGDYLGGIDDEFRDAAEEFGVPQQLLQAIGYAETQWQMIEGEVEFDGQEAAYGVMACAAPTSSSAPP